MARRARDYDWRSTPLGVPASWPQSLRTLIGLMLASTQPMFMAWGQQQTWLYNDAFIPILGHKHPHALARHALNEVWSEAKTELAALFDRVFAGESIQMQDIALMLNRSGRPEEAHFSFTYTPARDESGAVGGLFGTCIETTEQIVAGRMQAASQLAEQRAVEALNERLSTESENLRRLFRDAPGFMCVLRGPNHVIEMTNASYLTYWAPRRHRQARARSTPRSRGPGLCRAAGRGLPQRRDIHPQTGRRATARQPFRCDASSHS